MNTYYLVRHAHTDWTPNENRPLSALGLRDARRVADLLRQFSITAVYSSPYRRAEQTITPLAADLELPIIRVPELRERTLGDIGTVDFLAAVRATWEDPGFAYPGGESNRRARQRALAFLHHLQARHSGEHLVLSTHGNLLALLLQGCDPAVDYEFWHALSMPDIIRLVLDGAAAPRYDRLWPGLA